MTILIPIDRSSIRKNPNARKDYVDIPQIIITYWYTKTYIEISNVNIENIRLYDIDENKEFPYTYVSFGTGNLDNVRDFLLRSIPTGANLKSRTEQPVQRLYSITPEPEYLYEYVQKPITCEHCMCKHKLSELDWEDTDGYNHISYSCPKCKRHMMNDDDILYEKFYPEIIEENK